jgi:hypothetical protein
MTATATLSDDRKSSADYTPSAGEKPAPQSPEQIKSSVYAAYWQERSGFFSAESELPHRPSTR